MIGIAILAIVTALAFPSYKAWIQNTRIKTTTSTILNGIQIARAEAVRRNAQVQFMLGVNPDLTVGCLGGGNSCWTVGCVNFVAEPVAPAVTPPGCPLNIQSRPASDPTGTIIVTLADATGTLTPANNTVVFTNLGGLAAAPVPFAQANVTVSTTLLPVAQSTPLRVTLGTGGNARMCDPAIAAAADPRKC